MTRMSDKDYQKLLREVNRRISHAEEVVGADVAREFRSILEPILEKQQEQDTRLNTMMVRLFKLEVGNRR